MACTGRNVAIDSVNVYNGGYTQSEIGVFVQIFVFIFWILSGPYAISVGNEAKKCKEANQGRHCQLYAYYYWAYWIAGGLGTALYALLFFLLLGWLGMSAALATIKKGKELFKIKTPFK